MASGNGVTLALCSPQPVLPSHGSTLGCVSAPVPVEACSSMRPFALWQRRSTLRSFPAATSTFLACIFKAILKILSDPFGSALPPPVRFWLLSRARSTCETRCQIRSQNFLPVPKSPLPFGTSRSLGLVAPNLVSSSKAYHSESPDLPSLPAAPK